jgi:hypothetical protein
MTGAAANAADAERKPRRVIFMSWFPENLKKPTKKRELEPGFDDDGEACRISCGAATFMVNQT